MELIRHIGKKQRRWRIYKKKKHTQMEGKGRRVLCVVLEVFFQ